jgi:signal transduction histidine kinase
VGLLFAYFAFACTLLYYAFNLTSDPNWLTFGIHMGTSLVFLFMMRFELVSLFTLTYYIMPFSLLGNFMHLLPSLDPGSSLAPFFAYICTGTFLTPLSAIYFTRGTYCLVMSGISALICIWSFFCSLGKTYTITFTMENHLVLLIVWLIFHVYPVVFFFLYQAEVEVYHSLLAKTLKFAEEKNEAKTQFISRMSHELRTPLHGLLSSVSLLRQTRINEEQESYLTIIDSCGDLVLDIVFKILDITKIESGRFESHPVDFSLFEVVENVSRSVASLAEAKGLDLGVHFDLGNEEGYDVHGDKAHFHEILINVGA